MSSNRRSGYESIDDSELEEPSEDGDTAADEPESGCFARFRTLQVYFFTDWPWETAEHISVPKAAAKKEKSRKADRSSSTKVLIACSVIILLRLSLVTSGIVVQFMTCFRRDRITTDLTPIPNTTTKLILDCSKKSEIIGGLIIPDIVILFLAFWVYFGLKFGSQYCRGCLGWKELNVVVRADSAKTLNKLVQAINCNLLGKSLTRGYTVIPLFYIMVSQGASVLYMFAFQLENKDVIIQPPIGKTTLAGDVKYILISLAFAGFIALDLEL